MSLSMYVYPHQGIASFHPTSNDSLCGAHGRRNGSMHLRHIYCKIKQRIHGDDQDCAHMWKVDDGMKFSFIWIT